MITIFTELIGAIDTVVGTYVSDTTTILVAWFAPIWRSLLIIYVAFWGILHLRGMMESTLRDGFNNVVKIAVVMELALNVGTYNALIVDFLYNGPEQLAVTISGAKPSFSMLDQMMSDGFSFGTKAWDDAGILNGNIGYYFIAMIIWIGVAAVTAYAGFLLILSKIALSVLLALGPLFIALILFNSTKKFFESWLGQVLNYGILIILAVATVHLMLNIFKIYLARVSATSELALSDVIALTILAVINVLVLAQVSGIASALSGGIALSTMGAAKRFADKAGNLPGKLRPSNIQKTWGRAKREASLATSPVRAGLSAYKRKFGGNSVSGS